MARHALFALVALLALALAPAARAQVVIADRAGPLREGEPRHPEDGLAAVRDAVALGAGVGLDAALSADGVPFAFPDADLGRLTSCAGPVAALPAAALAECVVLGPAPAPVPTLRAALAEAQAADPVVLTVAPGDLGRLPAILEAVPAARPPAALIVRSASPAVLLAAAAQRPGTQLALLTSDPAAPGPHGWAASAGPVDAAWVAAARAAGRRVLLAGAEAPGAAAEAASLGADALLTADPAATLAALGRPVAPAGAAPGPPLPELLHPSLASDGATTPRVALRWRDGAVAEIRPRDATDEADWRLLTRDAGGGAATFTGAPGTTYTVRVRGAGGRAAEGALVVPLDEADRPLRRSRGGWRRVRRPGAWGGRVALARRRGATLRLSFRGQGLRVVAPLHPAGGRLRVRIDGAATDVSLRGPAAARQVVLASPRLEARRHRVTLTALGGGPVAVDALAPE